MSDNGKWHDPFAMSAMMDVPMNIFWGAVLRHIGMKIAECRAATDELEEVQAPSPATLAN